MGSRIRRLSTCLGWICFEKTGSQCTEPTFDARRFRWQLGSRHSSDQHTIPEGSKHLGLWQGLACSYRIQSLSDSETKSVLVDSSATRRKAVELEQLPNWHDPGFGWCWRNSGAHPVQSKIPRNSDNSSVSRARISRRGKDCSGNEHQASRSQWSSKNWPMRSAPVLIKFQIVVSLCGGRQPSIVQTYFVFRPSFSDLLCLGLRRLPSSARFDWHIHVSFFKIQASV